MISKIIKVLDAVVQKAGMRILPAWRVQWWTAAQSFDLRGHEYSCFYHRYNCGWPPYVSERSVELAIADDWLSEFQPHEVIEIGAVTPYYWPHRVSKVVDPFDEHPLVTDRRPLSEVRLDLPTLSISTFEHIGMGDYGSLEKREAVNEAFAKLFAESKRFLITVPLGYNSRVDELLLGSEVPEDVSLDFVVRTQDGSWRSTRSFEEARLPYGDAVLKAKFQGTSIGTWANSVAILQRSPQSGLRSPTA